MSVAGPSRATPSWRPAPSGAKSSYEEGLLEILSQLDLGDQDDIRTFLAPGAQLTDYDIALNDLIQQARALAIFNQDRALAERIAAGEDVDSEVDRWPAPDVARQPDDKTSASSKRKGKQRAGIQAARGKTESSQTAEEPSFMADSTSAFVPPAEPELLDPPDDKKMNSKKAKRKAKRQAQAQAQAASESIQTIKESSPVMDSGPVFAPPAEQEPLRQPDDKKMESKRPEPKGEQRVEAEATRNKTESSSSHAATMAVPQPICAHPGPSRYPQLQPPPFTYPFHKPGYPLYQYQYPTNGHPHLPSSPRVPIVPASLAEESLTVIDFESLSTQLTRPEPLLQPDDKKTKSKRIKRKGKQRVGVQEASNNTESLQVEGGLTFMVDSTLSLDKPAEPDPLRQPDDKEIESESTQEKGKCVGAQEASNRTDSLQAEGGLTSTVDSGLSLSQSTGLDSLHQPDEKKTGKKGTKRKNKRQTEAQDGSRNTEPSQTLEDSYPVSKNLETRPKPEPDAKSTGAAASKARASKRPTGHNCVICQDSINGREICAPCGHYYDIGCIRDLFQAATKDETLYPPRCCKKTIPFAEAKSYLSKELITMFESKKVEFGTLKRVYCWSPTCSQFLGPLSEGPFADKIYTCTAPGCSRRTCGKCREQYNGDRTHVCRPDADAGEVLALSKVSGWARCPGCSQMIELHIGCFHMTCRCRTEFCYLCLARWKTCRCPQWDEDRLFAVAEGRVNAQLGAARGAPPQPAFPPLVPATAPTPTPAAAPTRQYPRLPGQNQSANQAQVVVLTETPRTQAGHTSPAIERSPIIEFRRAQPSSTLIPTSSNSRATGQAPKSWAQVAVAGVKQWQNTASISTAQGYTVPTVTTPTSPWSLPSTSSSQWDFEDDDDNQYLEVFDNLHIGKDGNWFKGEVDDTAMRLRMIREMMDRLREDHDCYHERWHYKDGSGHCQGCGDYLPLYLFRCGGCEMVACNRCRRNRL